MGGKEDINIVASQTTWLLDLIDPSITDHFPITFPHSTIDNSPNLFIFPLRQSLSLVNPHKPSVRLHDIRWRKGYVGRQTRITSAAARRSCQFLALRRVGSGRHPRKAGQRRRQRGCMGWGIALGSGARHIVMIFNYKNGRGICVAY